MQDHQAHLDAGVSCWREFDVPFVLAPPRVGALAGVARPTRTYEALSKQRHILDTTWYMKIEMPENC